MEGTIILLIDFMIVFGIAGNTECSDIMRYLNTARSCFGNPKSGSCVFTDIDCLANGTNVIMINEIVYTRRTCYNSIKKECFPSDECCEGVSRSVELPQKILFDFEAYSECSGKTECYHNFRFDETQPQGGLLRPISMNVGYQCIEESKIQRMCEGGTYTGKQAHVMFHRQQTHVYTSSNCTCRIIASPFQEFRLYEIDIRLQKNWQSLSNQNSQHQCSKSSLYLSSRGDIECSSQNLEFSTMMSGRSSAMSEVDITLKHLVPDLLDNPMMVWLAVEGLNDSEVKVVCGFPNVFPDISWLQEPKGLEMTIEKKYMPYIIAASTVCACFVLIWCGCMYSRYVTRMRYQDTDDRTDSSAATVPMLEVEKNIQTNLTDEKDVNNQVNFTSRNEGNVDVHSGESLTSCEITPAPDTNHCYDHLNGVSSHNDINKSDITSTKDQKIYAKPQKRMVSSV